MCTQTALNDAVFFYVIINFHHDKKDEKFSKNRMKAFKAML